MSEDDASRRKPPEMLEYAGPGADPPPCSARAALCIIGGVVIIGCGIACLAAAGMALFVVSTASWFWSMAYVCAAAVCFKSGVVEIRRGIVDQLGR